MTTKQLQSIYKRSGQKIPHEFAKPDASKYNARKKELDGRTFDSTIEATAYSVIKLWERAGHILDLELQPVFVLQDGFRDAQGVWRRPIKYVADFRWRTPAGNRLTEPTPTVVVDVKGMPTPAFLMKAKIFRSRWPDVDLQIWNREKVNQLSRI